MLRHPVSAEVAERERRGRLRAREPSLVDHAERILAGPARSPYRRLLETAGCEPGDIARLVTDHGIEGALSELAAGGVYLTVDEFKGRRAVVRGSTRFECGPDALRNPDSAFHVAARSGGTRSPGTPVLIDLSFVRGCGLVTSAFMRACGAGGSPTALWETPGAGARFRLLKYASFGALPERWFSQVDPALRGLDPMLRWGERATRWSARLAGVPVPRPEHVSPAAPLPIARWMEEVLERGQRPWMFTFPSSAVHLCGAAAEAGVDLTGARIVVGGEPCTPARVQAIGTAGAQPLPRYGSMEAGPVGYACLAPRAPDDVHLLADLHAVIHPPAATRAAAGLPPSALLVTALHPASPFLMLNASMGDEGEIEKRACGCAVEALGYGVHLRAIRSFEKLTGEGVTFLDVDVIRVLEQLLPAEIGGGPTDYQLIEQEDDAGRARLRLVVDPSLGEVDVARVREVFLDGLGATGGVDGLMQRVWREADVLQVERARPATTRAGKIQHLHREPAAPG
jgi:hypothetical protein